MNGRSFDVIIYSECAEFDPQYFPKLKVNGEQRMNKLKVGDRVEYVPEAPTLPRCDYRGVVVDELGNLKLVQFDNGMAAVCHNISLIHEPKPITAVQKGDVLLDADNDEVTVIERLGELVFLSCPSFPTEAGDWYHVAELEKLFTKAQTSKNGRGRSIEDNTARCGGSKIMGGLGTDVLSKPESTLDRLRFVLEHQSNLITSLRVRLNSVSIPTPFRPAEDSLPNAVALGTHIEDLFSMACNNNGEIEQIMDSLLV